MPLPKTARELMPAVKLVKVRIHGKDLLEVFHILTVKSLEPEANVPSFRTAKALTELMWPVKLRIGKVEFMAFHILTVLSSEALAKVPSLRTISA